tara:strand:+ start:2402 stop:2938 length:537 start_codon:yes stop_codon:yes gene_type:complete
MSTSRIFPGIAMVGEYQKSGTPFCTASNSTEVNSTTTTQISFPRVTRWVEITPYVQSGAAYLKVAFTQNGINETGAVAGHIVIGEKTNAAGAVVDDTIQTLPEPNTYEKSATAKNWFAVPATSDSVKTGGRVRLELACTDLFLETNAGTAGVTIVAGLTNIRTDSMNLTGSQGYFGVG